MAGATLNHNPLCCKSCASFDRVSLTLEFCNHHKRPVFANDAACRAFTDATPWMNWAIDGVANGAHQGERENDQ